MTSDTFVVVSTQGDGDEEALEQAVRSNAAYVAFVASKVKARKVLEYVGEAGASAERVRQVRAPAGLDIHAASPEEIAVSILAEIVQVKGERTRTNAEAHSDDTQTAKHSPSLQVLNKQARDPVCGMLVDVSRARYKSEHAGSDVYFCCAGCKQTFDRQPEKYAAAASVSSP